MNSIALQQTDASRLVFVGDTALHFGPQRSHPSVQAWLRNVSSVIGCLEAPVCEHANGPVFKKRTSLRISPRRVTWLREYGFRALSAANNHILDFGERGFHETRRSLAECGIQIFGVTSDGEDMCAIDLGEGPAQARLAGGYGSGFRYGAITVCSLAQAAIALRSAPPGMLRVAFLHGGTEFIPFPDPWQYRATHQLISECSPDLVVWSHSHTSAPVSVIGKTHVAWGLGNWDLTSPENQLRSHLTRRLLALEADQRDPAGTRYLWKSLIREDGRGGDGRLEFADTDDNATFTQALSGAAIETVHRVWPSIDSQTWLPQMLAAFRWRSQRFGLKSISREFFQFLITARAQRAIWSWFAGRWSPTDDKIVAQIKVSLGG